ncbi:MAG: hypothetical protein ACRDD3_11690 [Azovibrio sp.]
MTTHFAGSDPMLALCPVGGLFFSFKASKKRDLPVLDKENGLEEAVFRRADHLGLKQVEVNVLLMYKS